MGTFNPTWKKYIENQDLQILFAVNPSVFNSTHSKKHTSVMSQYSKNSRLPKISTAYKDRIEREKHLKQ